MRFDEPVKFVFQSERHFADKIRCPETGRREGRGVNFSSRILPPFDARTTTFLIMRIRCWWIERRDANRFINLREPSGASILFVFRGWSIPVRAVTADTATPGSTPPRDDGKFAAEIKLAPRFRNWFPRRRIGGRPKFVSPRVEINFRIENMRSSNIREFLSVRHRKIHKFALLFLASKCN